MESKRLIAYLMCEKFNKELFEHIAKRYKATQTKGAISVFLDEDEYIVVFDFGVSVFWNVSYENTKFFLDYLEEVAIKKYEENFIEEFEFFNAQDFMVKLDSIMLADDDELTKIALSYAIAQSLKVEEFEKKIGKSIKQNAAIPQELAQYGEIKLNKKEISKKIGELFLVKSKVYLHYDLLDTPDFFWEYPEYEKYYDTLVRYLDINSRLEVLNKKAEIIQELLNVLGNEQNHKYSSFLEWIIILLIAFEIVFNLIDHIF
ncbi:MAG TPA: hypothetical protein CFH79_03605 [Sulfurospirillum sp. UBA11407]|nr:MAG TPA: hypothetical protein CFH79_03605 [Sulfurospirillum sp. UBA11407]